MKKSHELATLTGSQVMVLVASETGHVYTYSTPKFKPILNSQQGRKLIRTCLSDETRNVDEDDINIDEVKVDQLEEINQSDENADYGENDDNDVSDYREDEVFKVEQQQQASSSKQRYQAEPESAPPTLSSRPVQLNTVIYQSNRVVRQNQNAIEPEPPQRLVRVTGPTRPVASNTQYTVSSSIPVVIRGAGSTSQRGTAVIQPNGHITRLQKPEFVPRNFDAGGGGAGGNGSGGNGSGSNDEDDYEYYENGRHHHQPQQQQQQQLHQQQRLRPAYQQQPQQQQQQQQHQRQVVFTDSRVSSRVIQRR